MKRLLFLTLLFIVSHSYAQDSLATPCYFTSLQEYLKNEPNKINSFVSESNSEIVFYYGYTKVTLTSKNTWGYINSDGLFYRSVDFVFYKIAKYGKLIVYEATIDGVKKYKIGNSLNMYPVDLTDMSVIMLITDNKALLEKYQQLPKKERITRALEFVDNYNSEAFVSK
ncbi:MAG: hypothetical protein WCP57_02520 [Bacteroidota bacterium]